MSEKKIALSFVVTLVVGAALFSAGACGGSKTGAPTTNTPPSTTPAGNGGNNNASGAGTDTPDASVGGPDSGTPATPDAGQPTPDAGGEADAGMTPDGGAVVFCGTTSCAPGQLCCFLGLDAGTVTECRASCPSGDAVACDGPEDCSGTSALCCFTAELAGTSPQTCFPTSVKSECKGSCPLIIPPTGCNGTAQVVVCRQKSDCATNGSNRHCCPLPIGGVTACSAIPAANCLP